MGLTLVGVTTPTQRGNESAEVGINLESFSCRYYPQFKEKLNNYQGQVIGFAIPSIPSREVNIKGEVTGTAGIMAAAFATALIPANDIALFGASTGGLYPDEATESQTRDGWRTIDMKLSSDPLLA